MEFSTHTNVIYAGHCTPDQRPLCTRQPVFQSETTSMMMACCLFFRMVIYYQEMFLYTSKAQL